ncbi:hypothetical protein HKX48_007764 [Thoreauomyces humboldtii]|nr:hypothetical protein HKX48_007764 [Thoreauomyces humboldtii]
MHTVQIAIDWVNNQPDILPDAHVNLVPVESGFTRADAIRSAYEIVQHSPIAQPQQINPSIVHWLQLDSKFRIAFQMSRPASLRTEQHIRNTSRRNTFRLIQSAGTYGGYLAQFAYEMGWNNVAVIYSETEFGASFATPIVTEAQVLGMNVLANQGFNADGTLSQADLDSCIDTIVASKARIILLSAYESEATGLWLRMYSRLHTTTFAEYVWVTLNGIEDFPVPLAYNMVVPTVNETLGNDIANNVGVYLQQTMGANESTPLYLEYMSAYNSSYPQDITSDNSEPWTNEDLLFDCALSIFYGLDETIKNNVSLTMSMLLNPDYTQADYTPFTNISIFSTGKPGLLGNLTFEADGNSAMAGMAVTIQRDGEVNAFVQDYPEAALFIDNTVTIYRDQLSFFGGSTIVPTDLPAPKILNPEWHSGEAILFCLIAAFLLFTNVSSITVTYRSRFKPVIKRASWKSLMMVLFGLVLLNISPFLYIGTMTRSTCVAQPFILNMGFGLVFANLAAKNWRVFKIFNNPKMMARGLSDHHVLAFAAGIVGVEALLSLIWVCVSTPVETTIYIDTVTIVRVCQSPNSKIQSVMTAISIAFNGILLALTTVLSFLTRNVTSEFNESKWIGISAYNIVAVCGLFLPLVYTAEFAAYAYMFRAIAILIGTAVTETCIFAPKFLVLYRSWIKKRASKDGENTSTTARVMQSVMGSSKGNLLNAKSSATAVVRKLPGLQFTDVPVLQTSSGQLIMWNILSRWKKANVIALPGYICIEEIEATPDASSKINVYRTSNAVVRNGSTRATSSMGSVSIKEGSASMGGPQRSTTNIDKGAIDVNDLCTLKVLTLDGALEFVLTRAASIELVRQIQAAPGPSETLKVFTDRIEKSGVLPQTPRSHVPTSERGMESVNDLMSLQSHGPRLDAHLDAV